MSTYRKQQEKRHARVRHKERIYMVITDSADAVWSSSGRNGRPPEGSCPRKPQAAGAVGLPRSPHTPPSINKKKSRVWNEKRGASRPAESIIGEHEVRGVYSRCSLTLQYRARSFISKHRAQLLTISESHTNTTHQRNTPPTVFT